MRTISIYERQVLERGKRGYFNPIRQITVIYGDNEYKNHYESIDNPRLKVKFNLVYKSRSVKSLDVLLSKIKNRSEADKWLKQTLISIKEEI